MLIPIQWYKAAADAPKMPFPTSFMSLDWTSSTPTRNEPSYPDEPWLQRPGEVFGEARPYSPFPTPIGLLYDHVCGTEDEFVSGAVYDPTRDIEYDEQGLPLCCGGPAVPFFGLVLGFVVEIVEPPEVEAPSPSFDCTVAPTVDLGVSYFRDVIGGGSELWWTYGALPAGDYHFVAWVEFTDSNPGVGDAEISLFPAPCGNFGPPDAFYSNNPDLPPPPHLDTILTLPNPPYTGWNMMAFPFLTNLKPCRLHWLLEAV